MRQISIAGNENIESDKIREALTLATGSTLDYPLLFENRERIEGLYRAQGYYLAKVELRDRAARRIGGRDPLRGGGGREAEAPRDRLHRQRALRRRRAHARASRPGPGASGRSPPRGSTTPAPTRSRCSCRTCAASSASTATRATSSSTSASREVVAEEDGLIVRVPIREGQQFRVGKIDVTGDSTVDIDALREKLELKTGDVFNRSHLNDDIAEAHRALPGPRLLLRAGDAALEPLAGDRAGRRRVRRAQGAALLHPPDRGRRQLGDGRSGGPPRDPDRGGAALFAAQGPARAPARGAARLLRVGRLPDRADRRARPARPEGHRGRAADRIVQLRRRLFVAGRRDRDRARSRSRTCSAAAIPRTSRSTTAAARSASSSTSPTPTSSAPPTACRRRSRARASTTRTSSRSRPASTSCSATRSTRTAPRAASCATASTCASSRTTAT